MNTICSQCQRMNENKCLPIENFSFRIEFHGSKLFTQKGSGYFHVFNASICGKTNVICTKTSVNSEILNQKKKNIFVFI